MKENNSYISNVKIKLFNKYPALFQICTFKIISICLPCEILEDVLDKPRKALFRCTASIARTAQIELAAAVVAVAVDVAAVVVVFVVVAVVAVVVETIPDRRDFRLLSAFESLKGSALQDDRGEEP